MIKHCLIAFSYLQESIPLLSDVLALARGESGMMAPEQIVKRVYLQGQEQCGGDAACLRTYELYAIAAGLSASIGYGGFGSESGVKGGNGKVVSPKTGGGNTTKPKTDPNSGQNGGGGVGGSKAEGLKGVDFENWLQKNLGGTGSFKTKNGREIDGKLPNGSWYEAKSGLDYTKTDQGFTKFPNQIGSGVAQAAKEGASYTLVTNVTPPKHVLDWLSSKNIPIKIVD